MKKNNIFHLIVIAFAVLATSCGPTEVNSVKKTHDTIGETFVRVNKYMVDQDKDLIQKYAQRHHWDMNETELGLFYEIIKKTNGKKPLKGEIATIEYRVELLDGTLCYSSDSTGNKSFRIGGREVVTGLDDGILLLKKGEEAHFIIPPHLANGLSSDGDRIPPRSVLVYWVRVVSFEKSNNQ